MAYWLFKEEPDHYSLEDLFRDKRAVWAGVGNNLALKHLRSVKKGDRVLYYHTGKEKAVVGVMEVVKGPNPDPARDENRFMQARPGEVAATSLARHVAIDQADEGIGDGAD